MLVQNHLNLMYMKYVSNGKIEKGSNTLLIEYIVNFRDITSLLYIQHIHCISNLVDIRYWPINENYILINSILTLEMSVFNVNFHQNMATPFIQFKLIKLRSFCSILFYDHCACTKGHALKCLIYILDFADSKRIHQISFYSVHY